MPERLNQFTELSLWHLKEFVIHFTKKQNVHTQSTAVQTYLRHLYGFETGYGNI